MQGFRDIYDGFRDVWTFLNSQKFIREVENFPLCGKSRTSRTRKLRFRVKYMKSEVRHDSMYSLKAGKGRDCGESSGQNGREGERNESRCAETSPRSPSNMPSRASPPLPATLGRRAAALETRKERDAVAKAHSRLQNGLQDPARGRYPPLRRRRVEDRGVRTGRGA